MRWSRRSRRRSSSGTPQRTLTSPPNTPTVWPRRSRPVRFPTPCTCSPTARTALAWPRTLARSRSGPRWRVPGSRNRRHGRIDSFRAQDAAENGHVLDPGRAVPDAVLRLGGRIAVVPGVSSPVPFLGGHADRGVRGLVLVLLVFGSVSDYL